MAEDVPRRDDEGGPRRDSEPTQPVDGSPSATPADPWSDAEPVPGTTPDLPPVDPAATRVQPGADDTAYDDIRLTPEDLGRPGAGTGPSGTGVLPTVPDEPPPPPKWSARAQVRPRGDEDEEVYRQADEWDDRDRPRTLLVPVLIGLVVLLFLALIALGVWLGLRNQDGGPAPGPSTTTASPTATSPRTTPPPTTATTTTPAEVPIPPLRGQSFAVASKTLTDLGFKVERSDEPSLEVQDGQVIGTNPPQGTTLRPGATITIVVSTGPPEGPPTSAPPTSPPA